MLCQSFSSSGSAFGLQLVQLGPGEIAGGVVGVGEGLAGAGGGGEIELGDHVLGAGRGDAVDAARMMVLRFLSPVW